MTQSNWQRLAKKAAARSFERDSRVSMKRLQDVVCVTLNVPADQDALIEWLRNRLQASGVRELAYAVHPPAGQDRRAHALLLEGEVDQDFVKFVALKSKQLGTTGRARVPDGDGVRLLRVGRRRGATC